MNVLKAEGKAEGDDVTRAWGVLVNVLKAEGDDVTREMSKGGGACECLHPPPLQEILYPCLIYVAYV